MFAWFCFECSVFGSTLCLLFAVDVALLRVYYLCTCVWFCLFCCLLGFLYMTIFVYDMFRFAFSMLFFSFHNDALFCVDLCCVCCLCVSVA